MTYTGKLFKERRLALNLNLTQTSQLFGVSKQFINSIEMGRALPPKARFYEMIRILKINRTAALKAYKKDLVNKLK